MEEILKRLDVSGDLSGAGAGSWLPTEGEVLSLFSPLRRQRYRADCSTPVLNDYAEVMHRAADAFEEWKAVPIPREEDAAGWLRQLGNAYVEHKRDLGPGWWKWGRYGRRARGEVQEMIDMAKSPAAMSRMLSGLSMQSERPGHRMYEQWHPWNSPGSSTALNFPVAVWAWNAMLALIAGDTVVLEAVVGAPPQLPLS